MDTTTLKVKTKTEENYKKKNGNHVIVAVFGVEHGGGAAQTVAVGAGVDVRREAQRQDPLRHQTQVHHRLMLLRMLLRMLRMLLLTPRLRRWPQTLWCFVFVFLMAALKRVNVVDFTEFYWVFPGFCCIALISSEFFFKSYQVWWCLVWFYRVLLYLNCFHWVLLGFTEVY